MAVNIATASITVDHDVPGPNKNENYSLITLPWDKLALPRVVNGQKLYDSFFVPGKNTNKLGPAKVSAEKRCKAKFVTRTVTENGVEGVRVWRIENPDPSVAVADQAQAA